MNSRRPMSNDLRPSDPVMPKITRSGEMQFSVENDVVQPKDRLEKDALGWDKEGAAEKVKASMFTWQWLLVYIGCALVISIVVIKLTSVDKSQIVVEAPVVAQIEHGPPVFNQPPREVVDLFVKSSDPKERLKWVRTPDLVAERLSQYPAQALAAPVEELVELGMVNNGREVVAGFGAVFKDGTKRLISVIPTQDGPRVDWDCYARYCSASWSQILAGQVESAEIRVYATPTDYYNFSFRSELQWDAYVMSSPDLDGVVYGYAEKGSKMAKILRAKLPWQQGAGLQMTLQIQVAKDEIKHRQFKISRVLAYSWVRGEKDLQDTWVDLKLDDKRSTILKEE